MERCVCRRTDEGPRSAGDLEARVPRRLLLLVVPLCLVLAAGGYWYPYGVPGFVQDRIARLGSRRPPARGAAPPGPAAARGGGDRRPARRGAGAGRVSRPGRRLPRRRGPGPGGRPAAAAG